MKPAVLGRAVLDIVQLCLMWVAVIFGVTSIGIAGYEGWFLHRAVAATGTIVSMDVREDVGDGGTVVTYVPVFTFTTQGREVAVHSNAGGKEDAYRIGQTVAVRYLASDPEHAQIESFGQTWGLSLGFLIAAGACGVLWGAMRVKRGAREFPVYLFSPQRAIAL
ncbi:Protein of unknown function [Bryocella elongata]|uniref:DUF3592 domain-containing protein n=1 Tax=Bryocella elongata TaxID=863522 RepID=A0A1H5TCU4_9BACT|nr:DUF3592 domain-containing protein [Bryocella elongata]SEF59827.1 Protein of unknown function [Bryocella elongata]